METQAQKNIINVLYVFLIFSTILSFVPTQTGQIASLALILVTLAAAYIYRMRAAADSLLYNHMTYMIGTIWIGGAFLIVGILAAAAWVYAKGDHTIIHGMMNSIQSGQILDMQSLKALFAEYMRANMTLLIVASLPTIGPAILYFVYRVGNGLGRAAKGYRIANPHSWL
jgi:uncharacterized membrane protein